MTPPDQPAILTWKEGILPVSTRFDDPYFTIHDGLAETRHVFLAGNALPDRLKDGFHIAELGFGTGLNLLATQIAWAATGKPGTLHYTSFEAYPLPAADIERALRNFPEAHAIAEPFLRQWARGQTELHLPGIMAHIILGDAQGTLPTWAHKADAWYLDGFSPAKNPELWSETLMAQVGQHTAPNGTFATYTAAGHVRRALQAAGFQVDRRTGHGQKRHMSVGTLIT
ncbi:MAG: tRNA (5-methylaminomethyl-2-thiouridine)(34)-methyltransferase MnmD [Paracoccaceae bacterium]